MRTLTVLVTLLVAALSGCAANGTAGTAGGGDEPRYVNVRIVDDPVALNNSADADPNEVLCKRIPITGSRLKRPICMTRAEWLAEHERAQRHLQLVKQLKAALWIYR